MPGPVIISGATGGIGSAVASTFVALGTPVVLLGRRQATLEALARRLQVDAAPGAWIETHEADINDSRSVDATAATIVGRHGAPGTLVHAAGDHPVRRLGESTDAEWLEAIQGKLLGAVRLMRAFEPSMRSAGRGSVVLVPGLFRSEPSPLFPIGSALNAALGAVANPASRGLAPDGVRVNLVDPGPVSTARWLQTCAELAEHSSSTAEEIDASARSGIPMGRLASPEDIAGMARFLSSDDASYITGGSFVVDGGLSAGLV
ncbi:SDR family oxidoreductase [Sanguibacter sp. Leaf3]|uniref:SDR family oxidoreductase n=1 Tax=Sanguibacter sp. Leaf3 TaxID=1736209 RepID=UPI0007008658|nr:SDR family oxidoreductase [Sanguibacter sp. Leaf3]KQU00378.1 hypothetical protein ASG53_06040 [Sanguibacter sp. Leaf3]